MRRKWLQLVLIISTLCNVLVWVISLTLFTASPKDEGNVVFYPRRKQVVHIVGKAAIADYLWQHILEGNVTSRNNGFFRAGTLETADITFQFLSGPGYIQTTIPQDIEYMVIVLNGRSDDKRRSASDWLNYMRTMQKLKKVGVVLLGDEKCQNDWILPHLDVRSGGVVSVLFIVYDSALVNNENIFQWPLGVATYRGFPISSDTESVDHLRRFMCNFMGTVYANSSRSKLLEVLSEKHFTHTCVNVVRHQWASSETHQSLSQYVDVLNNSDYTLCPVGQNTECYRIYEALSLGSIPVVEDVMTSGQCVSPLRLLKKYNAPIIYINDWMNLNSTLSSLRGKVNKDFSSTFVVQWYSSFKRAMGQHFQDIVKRKLLSM